MRRFLACVKGNVIVLSAIVLPLALAFTSLSVEVGHWYLTQREMQGAADAAALSAAADYENYLNNGFTSTSTSFNTVGVTYAAKNGFTTPASVVDVCLYTSLPTTRCNSSFPSPICAAVPCVAVDITQQQSPMLLNHFRNLFTISEPDIMARAVVSISSHTQTITTPGNDCVLALANDSSAILVHGNGDLRSNCGLAADGGLDQNKSGTPQGGITFNGSPSQVNITNLTVAAATTGCPSSHCFLFNPSTTPLPASAVKTSTATADPLAGVAFPTVPLGVQTGGVAIKTQGSGYTNGTITFTVQGGTGSPAKFTATVSGGKVTAIVAVTDPGAYTVMPTNPVTATPSSGGGTGATFNLTEGCFTWNGTPIAGRKYCSINMNGAGTTNFPPGSYYIAGGDPGCAGFCVSSKNATVTAVSAGATPPGVTFYLTHGEGSGTFGTNSYATIAVSSGTVSLCAPGTVPTGSTCGSTSNTCASGSNCILFFQDRNATASTSNGAPANTVNNFSGNGTRVFSGLMYLPEQTFDIQGNSTIGGCLGIIAKYVNVGGTPTFSNGCLPGGGFGGGITTITTYNPPQLTQ